MGRLRWKWWNAVAEQRQWLCLGMSWGEVPFEAYVAALKDLERKFAREARTSAERLHLQRLTAVNAVQEAFNQARPWEDFGPWLRRIQRLGFPDLWTRHQVACCYVQSLIQFPEQAPDAFAMLADTERRVRRLRADHPSRQQMLDYLAQARRESTRYGIKPPER